MTGRFWTRLLDKAFDAWWLDILVTMFAFLLVTFVPVVGRAFDLLGRLSLERRLSVYTDLITIATLLGGFLGLAFTTYLGWSSRGILHVKDKVGDRLLVVWLVGIASPWLSALLVLLAKVLDNGNEHSHSIARWFVLAAALLLVLTFVRLMTLFVKLAKLNDESSQLKYLVNSESLSVPQHFLTPRSAKQK